MTVVGCIALSVCPHSNHGQMCAHSRSQNCQAQPTAARVSPAPCSAASLRPVLPSLLQAVSGSPDSLARYRASMLNEFLRHARKLKGGLYSRGWAVKAAQHCSKRRQRWSCAQRRRCCRCQLSSRAGQHSRVVLHTACQTRRWSPVPARNRRELGNPCLTRMPVWKLTQTCTVLLCTEERRGSFKRYSSLI